MLQLLYVYLQTCVTFKEIHIFFTWQQSITFCSSSFFWVINQVNPSQVAFQTESIQRIDVYDENQAGLYATSLRQKQGIKMPLGNPLTKAHIVLLWEERTLMPFPLIDALGMSNIYKNVMAWQPAIKLVITEPVQKPDRKEEMLGVMSAWRTRRGGTEACKQLFSDCLRLAEISKRVLVMLWKTMLLSWWAHKRFDG